MGRSSPLVISIGNEDRIESPAHCEHAVETTPHRFIKEALAVVARTAKNQHSERAYQSIFDLDKHTVGRHEDEGDPPNPD